jgi:hypothetical protein
VDRLLSRCAGEKQKTPTGQTEAKTMEYQSNHNSKSASTASNGAANTVATTRRNRLPTENPEKQQPKDTDGEKK